MGLLNVSKTQSVALRDADGDLIYFAHKGKGKVLTEFGALDVRAGHYLVVPKCAAHSFVVDEPFTFLTIESKAGPFTAPDRGIVGQHAVYDPHALGRPSLEGLASAISKHPQKDEVGTVVDVKHNGEHTRFYYEDSIFDVLGWRGEHYPTTLHLTDIMPLMSHRAHLPPSAHSNFIAPGFVVCSFVPRPLESDSDALRVPFYHQNIDYDEILFYHDGDFFSRSGLTAGMVTLHPAGFPHGPHPKAIEKVKAKTHTDEYAVMIDARVPFKITAAAAKCELPDYWKSWQA